MTDVKLLNYSSYIAILETIYLFANERVLLNKILSLNKNN